MPNILFDSMGAQVQVQQETGNRLTTWYNSLVSLGYQINFTDYRQPIGGQLAGNDVLVITTRQWTQAPNTPNSTCPAPNPAAQPNMIPPSHNFSYNSDDLGDIPNWIAQGNGLLLFTNHTYPPGDQPLWPIYDIQLAAALGIQTVYAAFQIASFNLPPAPTAPPALIANVKNLQALDSGGIAIGRGTAIVPLPPDCKDAGSFGYDPAGYAFAALYTYQKGNVIVAGHSGITGNAGTCWPSQGQIGAADNETFLNNCIAYLASSGGS